MRLSDTGLTVLRDAEFDDLGLLPNDKTTLGFVKDRNIVDKVGGPVIVGYDDRYQTHDVTSSTWAERYMDDLERIGAVPYPLGAIVAKQSEDTFWALHEQLVAQGFYPKRANYIGQDCRIHSSAVIGSWDVGIHRGHGQPITNAGYVHLGDRVTIGANTCVDRSVWKKPTVIGDDTQIDNLVHVAHNVTVGKRCLIIAGTVLGGSTVIEDDCFLGIGVRTRPGVRIGKGSFIGMSVTVLEDVAPGSRLTCR